MEFSRFSENSGLFPSFSSRISFGTKYSKNGPSEICG